MKADLQLASALYFTHIPEYHSPKRVRMYPAIHQGPYLAIFCLGNCGLWAHCVHYLALCRLDFMRATAIYWPWQRRRWSKRGKRKGERGTFLILDLSPTIQLHIMSFKHTVSAFFYATDNSNNSYTCIFINL